MVELIVGLAITAVLMAVGVPSFLSAVKNSRMNSHYSSIVGSLYLARSEAVKQNSIIAVCARSTDTSCGSDWKNGWLTFVDNPVSGNTPGVLDSGETVIAVQGKLSGEDNTIEAYGLRKGTASSGDQSFIRYSNDGASNWTGGTFLICDDRGDDSAIALNIVITGDIRKARAAKDFQNSDLSC